MLLLLILKINNIVTKFKSKLKFKEGQRVHLLTVDGKPANGHAIIQNVDLDKECYTVCHFLPQKLQGEIIENVPQGRLLEISDLK